MFTPKEIMDDGTIAREDLPSNAFYLHERGYIELMVGYEPPLFAAARISPDGIELVEDEERFNQLFPAESDGVDEDSEAVMGAMMTLAKEAEDSGLAGIHRDWLLRDVTSLRDELRRPVSSWRGGVLREVLKWIEDYFEGDVDLRLPSMEKLKGLLNEKLKP